MAQMVKNLPAVQETLGQFLDWEDPLKKEMATHSTILAWRIPWTEVPGRLESVGLQRARHDWVTNSCTFLQAHFALPGRTFLHSGTHIHLHCHPLTSPWSLDTAADGQVLCATCAPTCQVWSLAEFGLLGQQARVWFPCALSYFWLYANHYIGKIVCRDNLNTRMKVISSIENLFCFFQEPGYLVNTEPHKVKAWVTQAVFLAGWSASK